jgi:hypothetical protein
MNLRDDYGSFFIKMKKTRDVGFIIYIKTNYLLKHHPKQKLNYFDPDKKSFLMKSHAPNKIWYIGFSGKECIGGEALQDLTIKEFKQLFTKTVETIYNCTDYPLSGDLHTAMNDSKTGIPPSFTKKWFEKQYQFIETQYATLNKK